MTQNISFSGRGRGFISLLNPQTFAPLGWREVGNITMMSTTQTEGRQIIVREGGSGLERKIDQFTTENDGNFEMMCSKYSIQNLANTLFGLGGNVAAGAVVAFPVRRPNAIQGVSVLPRFNIDLAGTITLAQGATTFVRGTDYVINRQGIISYPQGSTVPVDDGTAATALTISYSHLDYDTFGGLGEFSPRYSFLGQINNRLRNDEPCRIYIPQVQLTPTERIDYVSIGKSEGEMLTFRGSIIYTPAFDVAANGGNGTVPGGMFLYEQTEEL